MPRRTGGRVIGGRRQLPRVTGVRRLREPGGSRRREQVTIARAGHPRMSRLVQHVSASRFARRNPTCRARGGSLRSTDRHQVDLESKNPSLHQPMTVQMSPLVVWVETTCPTLWSAALVGGCRQVVELLRRGTVSCCEGDDLADVAAVEMLERSRLGHRQHEKRLVREPLKMHPYVSAGSARSATSICVELAGRCVNRLRLLHALKDEAVLKRSNRPPSRPGAAVHGSVGRSVGR
jgi:hypothetical protein